MDRNKWDSVLNIDTNALVPASSQRVETSQMWDELDTSPVPTYNRWNFGSWGDKRTWAILFAIFFFGLSLAGAAWVLPHGRDSSVPKIHTY
jgi:hypothetical protein